MKCLNCQEETKNAKFCSSSCAATYNNKLSPKRQPQGRCKVCGKQIASSRKYCGKICKHAVLVKRKINQKNNIQCCHCKELFPATLEYFKLNSNTKDSLCSQCKKCNNKDTVERNRKRKLDSIQKLGGKCIICNYSKYAGSFDFHHLDPSIKEKKLNQNWHTQESELSKCVLVCRNCHGEIHAGLHPQYLIVKEQN